MGTVREQACQWARALPHPRLLILVCGRISTSLSRLDLFWPKLLVRVFSLKLQASGGLGTVRHQECQWTLTQKRTLLGGCALERGHSASLEPLAQLDDALSGVGAAAIGVDAAELVVGQTTKEGCVSMGVDRGGFQG